MKRGSIGRTAALGLLGAGLAGCNAGCLETIGQNILVGFGFSLGALPANFIADTFFADLLNPADPAE
jgi:hypothetical protein